MARNKYWYVNTYECGRAYGGPEEGGWWYAYGTLLKRVSYVLLKRKHGRSVGRACKCLG